MKPNKSLYFLHIPKTGGLVLRVLAEILQKHGINVFSTFGKQFTNFNDYGFINSHFGITPIEIENFDTAVLIRNPLDRVISNFIWFLMNNTFSYKADYANLSLEEKFKKYLFEDNSYNNIQTKFLTGFVNEEDLNYKYRLMSNPNSIYDPRKNTSSEKDLYEYLLEERTRDWYLTIDDFSLEYAKYNLDKCAIIGTTDNHDIFMSKIFNWILINFEIDCEKEFNDTVSEKTTQSGLPYYNYSLFTDSDGQTYSSQNFKNMLSDSDIEKINLLNSMDLEIYNYAKQKLGA